MDSYTVTDIAAALKRKEISSVEITQHFLNRIEHLDNQFNSFISINAEQALDQAKQSDKLRMKGALPSPLAGVPLAHKDNFCTQGIPTTSASKMLSNFVPAYDASVVSRLKEAGLVMLGKTNMDEFAMGSSNETSFYGPVKNPWDTKRVPGGSSGGSSAAVAGRLTPFATGSDTGGSIRQPASLCNLVGIKPTYGRVSRYGMVAFASSLDQAGPITHTVEDAAHIMNIISGADPLDSTSVDHPVPDYTKTLNDSVKGLTIGIPEEYFDSHLDSKVVRLIEEAIDVYEKLGMHIKKVNLKTTKQGIPLYYLIASAECASNLARYDGVHYGYRCDSPKDLQDLYIRSRSEGFGDEVKRRLLIGTHILSSEAYNAYYVKAQTMRTLIIQEFFKVFQEVDLILGPTTPGPAFQLQEKIDDPLNMYLSDIYTVGISLAGVPAISLPAGFINDLPIGMQLVGPAWSEARLLNAAHIYQKETNWHLYSPRGI